MDTPDKKDSLMHSAAMLAKDGIIIINRNGQIKEANIAALHLLCRNDKTLKGLSLNDIVVPENKDTQNDIAIPSGFSRIRTTDDNTVSVTSSVIEIENENFAVYIKKDDKQLENLKILESEHSTLTNIMNSSSEYSIIAMDLEYTILHFNPAAEKLFNKKSEDFIGKNIISLYPDRKFEKLIGKANKNGKHEFIIERENEDGSTRFISSTIMKMNDKDSNKTGYIVFSKDISELKKLERHLHQAQKMEAIGTLAGGISHDFNNILSAIFGYIQLAMNNTKDKEKIGAYLENIQKAGIRAKDLIKQIITFSKQENPDKSPINLSSIINEVTGLIRAAIPSNINIVTDIENDTLPIFANQTQIHQVLFNLCTNSVHAIGSKKGIIRISLHNFSLPSFQNKVTDPARFIRLIISDNGCGMDEKTQARMFDPYFTTRDKGEGTGMGLATVYGIIENHKGITYVRSRTGTGTDFEILFPVCELKENVVVEDTRSISTGDEHILLVDDELTIVESVKELIEELGYKVTTATNPIEALDIFKKSPESFDLIMSDKTMPEMSGDELAEEMLKIRKIPVILCSGYMDQKFINKCSSIGIEGFLKKPFLLSDMAKMIRELL